MKVEVITIGDELLIGQTIDTNSAWMAKKLNAIGLKINRINSIADTEAAIINTLEEVEKRSSIILITGGLGPTKDDITKSTLCKFFKTKLLRNQFVLERIEKYFLERGREILESNRSQADLPENCTILTNDLGTASGMWFERNGVIFVSMPGVPYEMKGLMEKQVLPRLKSRFNLPYMYHKTIMTEGIGESFLAKKVEKWESQLHPQGIDIAYLPSPGIVKVRLSVEGKDEPTILKGKVDRQLIAFKKLAGEYVFGEDDIRPEEAIAVELNKLGKTIVTAESCTGGNIARLLTSVAGSSAYFLGSVITYTNQLKSKLLQVKEEDLKKYGAVSKSVVTQMAEGAREHLDSDYALATSGIAGPDGGSEEKPVGTVWIALASKKGTIAKKFNFEKSRERNITRASLAALSLLRRVLNGSIKIDEETKSLV